VLFISGYSADGILTAGESAAVGPYLAKPFTQAELLEKVREVLNGPTAID
jgi:CheY-like chemotaxis protein